MNTSCHAPGQRQAAMAVFCLSAMSLCAAAVEAEQPVEQPVEQRVVFQSGMTVIARVLSDDGKTLTLNPGHGEMAFPRSMIREILPYQPDAYRGVPVPSTTPPLRIAASASRAEDRIPPTPSHAPSPHTPSSRSLHREAADDIQFLLDGHLTWGMSRSAISISSSVTQASSGDQDSGSGSTNDSSVDNGPGAAIRGVMQWGDGSYRPLAGLQISTDHAQYGGYTGRAYSLEILGGVGWNMSPSVQWDAVLGAGVCSAPWSLSGTISNPALSTETYSSSGTARGPLVRCEIGPAWTLDDWRVGLLIGAVWRSLEGSSTWTSSAGDYRGEDTLTIHAFGGYAGVSAGHLW